MRRRKRVGSDVNTELMDEILKIINKTKKIFNQEVNHKVFFIVFLL